MNTHRSLSSSVASSRNNGGSLQFENSSAPGIISVSVETQIEDGRAILSVAGELDLATAGLVPARVRELLAQKFNAVVLDLTGVTFIDCCSLEQLVDLHDECNKEWPDCLLIVASEGPVLSLAEMTYTQSYFRPAL